MLEIVVGGGVHGDRLDAHLAAGTLHAQRDLAAIGYYNLIQHAGDARLVPLIDDEQS